MQQARPVGVDLVLPQWCPPSAEAVVEAAGLRRCPPGSAVAGLVLLGRDTDRVADDWVRRGVPHVLVSAGPHAVTIGPFVDPGVTACVHCLEVEGGLPPSDVSREPAVLALALAWAARDLRRWAAGSLPSTWSATVRVQPDLTITRKQWLRHPHCGCGWFEIA